MLNDLRRQHTDRQMIQPTGADNYERYRISHYTRVQFEETHRCMQLDAFNVYKCPKRTRN